jgi:hypothetical protein
MSLGMVVCPTRLRANRRGFAVVYLDKPIGKRGGHLRERKAQGAAWGVRNLAYRQLKRAVAVDRVLPSFSGCGLGIGFHTGINRAVVVLAHDH